jgi:hypothetical protein
MYLEIVIKASFPKTLSDPSLIGSKKTFDEKRGTPKNARGSKKPLMKKETPIKMKGAQKSSNKKRGTPKNTMGSKRGTPENARGSKNTSDEKRGTPKKCNTLKDLR